jgi:hypothetical protein
LTVTKSNLKKMFELLAIAATLVTAPTLILGPQLVQAQQGSQISGRGDGDVQCPTTGEFPGNEQIFFGASKERGTLRGGWSIFSEFFLDKQGDITGGRISGKTFTLTGTEFFDNMCNSQTPATITITGQCGLNVPIQFRSSNGQTGEFVGNVACSR